MANDPKALELRVLLGICRINNGSAELTNDVAEELLAAAAIAARFRSPHDTVLSKLVPLLASALGRLKQYNPTHLPFGFAGPAAHSPGWVNRDDVERIAKQIIGMTHATKRPEDIALAVDIANTEAVAHGFIEEKRYDAWQPDMVSGTGWRTAISATVYGVSHAKSFAGPMHQNNVHPQVQTGLPRATADPTLLNAGESRRQQDRLGSYLYASTRATSVLDSSSVFFRVDDEELARAIQRLCNREFASPGNKLNFFAKPVRGVSLDDQLLLDEAIESLQRFDSSTICDPPLPDHVYTRAAWLQRAADWEQKMKLRMETCRPEPATVASTSVEAVEKTTTYDAALKKLLHVVERHRLLFLFCATPQRRRPIGGSYTFETLDRDDRLDADNILEDSPDEDGEFLFRHRFHIERFAQSAISRFGPGEGSRPSEFQDGEFVTLPNGSLPVWALDESDCSALEQSSESMLSACKELLRLPDSKRFQPLIKRVRETTHDEGQSRWYSPMLVRWKYLARLDDLIGAIRAAEIDFIEDAEQPVENQVSLSASSNNASAPGESSTAGHEATRDPWTIWGAANTIKSISLRLVLHRVAIRAERPSPYDDRSKLNADFASAEKLGYLLIPIARQLSLDPAPLIRLLREDKLWEDPVEKEEGEVLHAVTKLAERIIVESRIWCAEAGIDVDARLSETKVDGESPIPEPKPSTTSEEKGPSSDGDQKSKFDFPDGNAPPRMAPDQWHNAGLGLLMLLAQAYYKMLEQVISTASGCAAVDLELNQSYFWVTEQLGNLLKKHPSLADFPIAFAPMFPDLYPTTIQDVEWEDMVAPDAEGFLSTVQKFLYDKRYVAPEKQSEAWLFVELFRPSVSLAIERAIAYGERMRTEMQRLLQSAGRKKDIPDPPIGPQDVAATKPTSAAASDQSVSASDARTNGVYGPRTIVWQGVAHQCDLSKSQMDFLDLALRKDDEIDVNELMNAKSGLIWKTRYMNSKPNRDTISKFLSRLNTRLLDSQPPIRFSFRLLRERDYIVRSDPPATGC